MNRGTDGSFRPCAGSAIQPLRVSAEVVFPLPGHVAGDEPGKIHQILDSQRVLVRWGDSLWGIQSGTRAERWGELPAGAGVLIGGGHTSGGIFLVTKNEGGARIFCLDLAGSALWDQPLSPPLFRAGVSADGNLWTVEKWSERGRDCYRVSLLSLPDCQLLRRTEVLCDGFIPWTACTSFGAGVLVALNDWSYESARIGWIKPEGQHWVTIDHGDVIAVARQGNVVATIHDWESPITYMLWQVDSSGVAQKISSGFWDDADYELDRGRSVFGEPIFGYEGGLHLFCGNTWLRTSITDLLRERRAAPSF